MSIINEDWARRSKENMSFSDYREGSATASYNAVIAEVTEKIESAKAKVSPEAQQRLDSLLARYKVKYANWINDMNRNGANHVSIMISGGSNYNMKAHKRYLKREETLMSQYDEITNIDDKISSIVVGDKIIKSDDANAIEKLKDKIAKLEETQQIMKAANLIIRKKKLSDEEKVKQLMELKLSEKQSKELLTPNFLGELGFASYSLSNNNQNIRTTKERLTRLEKLTEKAANTPAEELTTEVNGIRIVDNLELQRLQIFFPGKPSAEVRDQLKKNGFRWAPSNGSWQSYRSYYAKEKAMKIVEGL